MKNFPLILTLFLGLGALTMATIRISNTGINRIKKHEALRLKPYKDLAGKWTIGYGHLIDLDKEQDLLRPEGITETTAENLLREDLHKAEKAVNDLVKVPLTGNQYDALVSFVYNVGSNAFKHSTLLKKLNYGDVAGAAKEFPKWRYAGGKESRGLLARRKKEQQQFIT